jgi:hypothetical protein
VLAVLVLGMMGVSGLSADTAAVETASVHQEGGEDSEWQFRFFVLLARVEATDARLREVRREAEEGRATQDDVKAAEREYRKAMEALERASEGPDAGGPRITVELKEATLEEALRVLFRDTPYSYVLSPEIGRLSLDPLTISLKEVDLQTAVRVICDTYDLLYRKEDSIYYFFPRSDVVTIGGRRVPLLGTIEVPEAPQGAEFRFSTSPGEVARGTIIRTSPWSTEVREHDLNLAPSTTQKPIDLQLDNVPIREAMAQLGKAADMEIVVHEAVPEDIRITAKVYRVSGFRLLTEIADQAGLAVAQERVIEVTDPEGHVTRHTPPFDELHLPGQTGFSKREFSIFHVVPQPELSVSGTGGERPQERSGVRLRRGPSASDRFLQWQAGEGENFAAVPLPQCLNCEQLIMGPDWQFCPHCGTKLPCDEEVGAEAR